MIKIADNVEYLDYAQAAREYGFSKSSMYTMVSREVFANKKFPRDNKGYISRPQLDAYISRKCENVVVTDKHTNNAEGEVPQGAPFQMSPSQEMLTTVHDIVKTLNRAMDFLESKKYPIVDYS